MSVVICSTSLPSGTAVSCLSAREQNQHAPYLAVPNFVADSERFHLSQIPEISDAAMATFPALLPNSLPPQKPVPKASREGGHRAHDNLLQTA